jgi:hypothetical protein
MSDWQKEAARLGMRTKFYYTVRELSNHAAELWVLRSLGTEILAGGVHAPAATQTGTSWLMEHLSSDYSVCWQNPLSNGEFDSAICDTGVSRWTNFYIEGLNVSTASSPHVAGVWYLFSCFDLCLPFIWCTALKRMGYSQRILSS